MLSKPFLGASCAALLLASSAFAQLSQSPNAATAPNCHSAVVGQEGSLAGFVPFGPSSLWNKDISAAPLDPNSAALINYIGSTVPIHPDFGAGLYQGSTIGIPYVVVTGSPALEPIHYTDSPDESEPGPMPIPKTAPIEGYPNPGTGDRHVLVLDNSNCWLYELYSSYPNADGSWNAGSGAVWDLANNGHRPWGWTSADAAGLPIFAGLARYDEILNGSINHALRFTLHNSRAAFTPPASHWAANSTDALAAPMGMRLRLKASVDISGFSKTNQVILTALKKYGMIMADNGSSMYISGTPDNRWSNDDLHNLGSLTANDFEVVQMNPIYTSIPTGPAPIITTLKSSAYTVKKGTAVTISWTATNASYYVLDPYQGMDRITSATIVVNQTTTFTLTAIGPYGRTTANVTVTAD